MTLDQLRMTRALVSVGGLALVMGLEAARPFHRGRKGLVRHSAANLGMALINVAMFALVFAAATAHLAAWSRANGFGLLHRLALPPPAAWIAAALGFDLWMYVWHRANHRIRFLARFHRMHHSDPAMDVTTAVRFHFGEIALSSLARLPVLALLGMGMEMLIAYEALLLPCIEFHHSNVALPAGLDRWLRLLVVSPNMHRVHHSHLREERDANYGSVFSFWDRLLGTYRHRPDPENIHIGLPDFQEHEWLSFTGMLRTPLR